MFQHTAARRRLPASVKSNIESLFEFQHTAARRRLQIKKKRKKLDRGFQHTAARRRLPPSVPGIAILRRRFNTQPHEGGCSIANLDVPRVVLFQHTAARRRLRFLFVIEFGAFNVSTHSHPKVAAIIKAFHAFHLGSFNTQPPEGGSS